MMGMMAIICQMTLAFDDPKSLRIISINASMVRDKDMPKTIRIYRVILSRIIIFFYFFNLSEIFKRVST